MVRLFSYTFHKDLEIRDGLVESFKEKRKGQLMQR